MEYASRWITLVVRNYVFNFWELNQSTVIISQIYLSTAIGG